MMLMVKKSGGPHLACIKACGQIVKLPAATSFGEPLTSPHVKKRWCRKGIPAFFEKKTT